MKTSIHGSIAVAALCALLAACGGSSDSPPPPTVLPASVAIANDARAEAGAASTFKTDLATTTGLTFQWDFGDGSTGTGATASHAYAKPGTYQVTLAVANDAEDLRTATSTIEVGAYANVTGLVCSQADSAGWCWQHAIVTGHQINDVFFVDANHAWAVGDGQTILQTSDGGSTWTQATVDPSIAVASLRSVRFYDAMHGMVLNDQGSALQTTDGGATWTLNTLGYPIMYYGGQTSFVEYDANRIVINSLYGGNAAMSADGGTTWSAVANNGQMQATATDCWSFNSSYVVRAAGCGATVATSLSTASITNGAQYLQAGAFSSATQGLVVGFNLDYATYSTTAQAWSTADGGTTWNNFAPAGLSNVYYYSASQTLHMSDALNGALYVPNDLSGYVTRDGGAHWSTIVSSTALTQAYYNYRATGFMGNGVLWQSAANRVSISIDGAQTWHDATLADEGGSAVYAQSTALSLVQYTDASNFVVATSHRFYVTHDAGQTFTRILGPDSRDAGAPSAAGFFFDIHNGKIITGNGALLSTADGGRTWTRSDYPTSTGQPVALYFTSATEGWMIINGVLEHSTDGGKTWSMPLTSASMVGLQGMSWGDATHAWVWNFGTLFVTADAGATWTAAVLPANVSVSSAVMTGPRSGVVASGYGTSAASTQDGGATWQTSSGTGAYGTLVRAGSGQTIWSLSGSPMRSKDGGLTWQSAGPFTSGLTITGLAFADDLHGWMITNGGGVLHTIDGGNSWTAQPVGNDLQLEAIVAVDSQTAWIVTRDGQVLSTATAGN